MVTTIETDKRFHSATRSKSESGSRDILIAENGRLGVVGFFLTKGEHDFLWLWPGTSSQILAINGNNVVWSPLQPACTRRGRFVRNRLN